MDNTGVECMNCSTNNYIRNNKEKILKLQKAIESKSNENFDALIEDLKCQNNFIENIKTKPMIEHEDISN